jgi:hypothetical protein
MRSPGTGRPDIPYSVLQVSYSRTPSNDGRTVCLIDRTLVSVYPNDYAADLPVMIPMHGAREIAAKVSSRASADRSGWRVLTRPDPRQAAFGSAMPSIVGRNAAK